MINGERAAFPVVGNDPDFGGLTKREYFAAMAMQGLIAGQWHNSMAQQAVEFADELLEALEPKEKEV